MHWVPNLHFHMHLFVEWGCLRPDGILRQSHPLPLYTSHPISSAISTAILSVFLSRKWKLAQSLMPNTCLPFPNYFLILNQPTSTHLWLWLLGGCFWSARYVKRMEIEEPWKEWTSKCESLPSMAMNEELQISVFPQSFNTQYLFSCLLDDGYLRL